MREKHAAGYGNISMKGMKPEHELLGPLAVHEQRTAEESIQKAVYATHVARTGSVERKKTPLELADEVGGKPELTTGRRGTEELIARHPAHQEQTRLQGEADEKERIRKKIRETQSTEGENKNEDGEEREVTPIQNVG